MSEVYVPGSSPHETDAARTSATLAHLAAMSEVLGGNGQVGAPDDFGSSGPPGVGTPAPNTIAEIQGRMEPRRPLDEL